MTEREISVDVCVIGAGAGGLSVAAAASRMGARVALVEKGEMGGDCLNYGCVPSKALLAAGHAAKAVRRAAAFGVASSPPQVEADRVRGHVRGVIRAIAPHDSQERFEGLGVRVIRAQARFICGNRVQAGGVTVQASRFVVATGSRPAIPLIPGLDRASFLTNESIFNLQDLPRRLIIIGGGPIGVEMAEAHRNLGSDVVLLARSTILPRDDGELVEVLRRGIIREGVDLRERARIAGVESDGESLAVILEDGERLRGSHLMIAAGRRPNVEDLGLDDAGVRHGPGGIHVDGGMRTTNRRIYAVGDVTGGPLFTHMAGHQAGIVIRNMLFRLPARLDSRALPWVTYTDPELAQVGLTEAKAVEAGHENIRVLKETFAANDRARVEGRSEGMIKLITTKRGRILGAGIVGFGAGELIQTWGLAISRGIKVGAVASQIAPYPTLGEINKKVAGNFFTPTLFSDRTRALVRFLLRFG